MLNWTTAITPLGTINDEELAAGNLKRAGFHGDWNYAILPTQGKHNQLILARILSQKFCGIVDAISFYDK